MHKNEQVVCYPRFINMPRCKELGRYVKYLSNYTRSCYIFCFLLVHSCVSRSRYPKLSQKRFKVTVKEIGKFYTQEQNRQHFETQFFQIFMTQLIDVTV